MGSLKLLESNRSEYLRNNWDYKFYHYTEFDYRILQNCISRKYNSYNTDSYNDITIMFDTETSKKHEARFLYVYHKNGKEEKLYQADDNHVVIWTLTIRLFDLDIATLYGRKPSELVKCIDLIREQLKGQFTHIYAHNLGYDYTYLRKFFFKAWGYPVEELNVKTHYPIMIKFENGIVLKDSLILAQRGLEKWAKDLDVAAKKQSGTWDYDKIRNQSDPLTDLELKYAEYDTLSGTQCIDKLRIQLHKYIGNMPYTSTGILRELVKLLGTENKAKKLYNKLLVSWEEYQILVTMFHGGYVHGNRNYLGSNHIFGLIQGFDFASSYPYIIMTHKFPMTKFVDIKKDVDIDYILRNKDDHAFMFRWVLVDVKLKDENFGMPILQYSKCKTLNDVTDNGRIIAAQCVALYTNEIDAALIDKYYTYNKKLSVVTEVKTARKDYLPKWYRDLVYQLFIDKTKLKGVDDILYTIQKFKINACFGLMVQRLDKIMYEEIFEDREIDGEMYHDGEYVFDPDMTQEMAFNKNVKKRSTILPYQWGVWITSYAMSNLFELGSCCKIWLYSDTDSVYGIGWDKNKVKKYNKKCKNLVRAAGYTGVEHKGKIYWPGVAETSRGDKYSEFKYVGAKRYCGRSYKDNKLHITVAGVPKSAAFLLRHKIPDFRPYKKKCKNAKIKGSYTYVYKDISGSTFYENDISEFKLGFTFDGEKSGKKLHTYKFVDDIYIDENGNETGDSVDLSPCDYILSEVSYHSIDEYINATEEEYMECAEEYLDMVI